MSRRYSHSQPVAVEIRRDGSPLAFTWRGVTVTVTYRVRVIGRWELATRWWDTPRHSDRTYYRVETPDHQIFELYYEAASTAAVPDNKRWCSTSARTDLPCFRQDCSSLSFTSD